MKQYHINYYYPDVEGKPVDGGKVNLEQPAVREWIYAMVENHPDVIFFLTVTVTTTDIWED